MIGRIAQGSMIMKKKILRVLVVEDNADDLAFICYELAGGGFAVVHECVETEASLEAALADKTWDIVICDHNMPALNSAVALNIVQRTAADMPFIIVSGLIPDEVAIESMRSGAKDFIRKDNLSRLVPVVERELKEAAVRNDLRQAQEYLHRATHFDSLTGLPNREYLFESLASMTSEGRGDFPFAVFMVDLNRFRKITRSLGIETGNKVLIEVAQCLRGAFGNMNLLARCGADRFIAVVESLDQEEEAREIAANIHEGLNRVLIADGHELFVTASVGASFYPKDGNEAEELLKNVESALYAAKVIGGRSFQAYHSAMETQEKVGLAMEGALYRALENNEFMLHYQPQFDLSETRLIGAEALIRWKQPESIMIPPGVFIPLLEETGLIVPVGEWILRSACAQNKKWQDAGFPPVRIAVNLSVIQFQQADLVQTVRKVLQETGLAPEYLELEITENIAVHNEETVIAILNELRKVGIHIAIDDFGTGYSSLSYLKRFPIDKLKIDQSFVRDCKDDMYGDGIVRAIIGMGHSLNLKVIAEGVETWEQADFLQRNGCDEVQGYFYSKPMTADDFASLMRREAFCPEAVE